jgi:hypothetical protein
MTPPELFFLTSPDIKTILYSNQAYGNIKGKEKYYAMKAYGGEWMSKPMFPWLRD